MTSPTTFTNRTGRLRIWWMAVNSLGVAVSLMIERLLYHIGVQAGNFNRPDPVKEFKFSLALFIFMLAMGALQVTVCCWIMSLLKSPSRGIQIFAGVVLGIFSSVVVSFLGIPFFWVYAFIGSWTFALTGIIFGSLVGYANAGRLARE